METIIKVDPSELTETLLDKIRKFIGNKKNIDVTISLKDKSTDYETALNRSMEQVKNNDVISFTMEDFMAYTPSKK